MAVPAFWSGRRVWLSGHTGFMGGWLGLWLQQLGAEVHGFGLPPATEPSLFEVADVADGLAGDVRGDVRSRSEVRAALARGRPEVVLHLAAQSLVRAARAKPVETFAVNATGTAKVLDELRALAEPPRAILVVTSDKCYRDDGTGRALHEGDALGDGDPLAASKAAQEHVASAFRHFGLPIATARSGNVVGGGDWSPDRLIPDFVRAAEAGEPLELRAPRAVRPWQHVLDTLDGYLRLVEALWRTPDAYAGPWNFGPAQADHRPVTEVVDALAARWPHPPPAAVPAEDAGPHGPVDRLGLRIDAARARKHLDWEPRWDLDAALDATADWYDGLRRGADMRALTLAQIEAYVSEG